MLEYKCEKNNKKLYIIVHKILTKELCNYFLIRNVINIYYI